MMEENYHNSEEYKLKTRFLIIIDGGYDFKPVVEGVDSCSIGLCKMEYIDNIFHVYLKRPGLLIGKKGETINRIEKLFDAPIKIHEVDLMRQGEEGMKNKPLTRIEFKEGEFKHYPTVDAVKNWQFEGNQTGEEEAELASCVAKVGTSNGLSAGDIQHAFPLILRMLKSKSVWTE